MCREKEERERVCVRENEGAMAIIIIAFQNGILSLTNSPSMDVDFITADGDPIQEYSCSISPGGDRDCISRAVDLRIKTIPGMHLHLKSSTIGLPFYHNYDPNS